MTGRRAAFESALTFFGLFGRMILDKIVRMTAPVKTAALSKRTMSPPRPNAHASLA